MLDLTQPYVKKIHYIDAELAGHVHKLDVKLQGLCWSGFSVFAVRALAKRYHFEVNWPTTLCENKDGVHFFNLKFECHNRYNKLLLCNSENGDIAWCNKAIPNGVFVFPKKGQKNVSFHKNKNRWVVLLKDGFFSTLIVFQSFVWFYLDRTIW